MSGSGQPTRKRCYYCGQPINGNELRRTCGYCRDLKALDPWIDPVRATQTRDDAR